MEVQVHSHKLAPLLLPAWTSILLVRGLQLGRICVKLGLELGLELQAVCGIPQPSCRLVTERMEVLAGQGGRAWVQARKIVCD